MTELMRYAALLADATRKGGLPPVERWNPPYCGEIDLLIRRDGLWIHEGTPIGRAPLVRLFSTVLKKEGERYFLVTPVEKLGIKVEDAPFLAVLMRRDGEGGKARLIFTTNVGDEAAAGPDHALVFRETAVAGEKAPYIHVRHELWALVARAVFYELVGLGEKREIGGEDMFGVASGGVFFPFGPASAVFGEG
ncbi:MAG: DUF1285 domain-containing protein [Parvularculaceae bacterium]